MSHVFYFMTALLAVYELAKMVNCRALYRERSKLSRMNEQDRALYLDYSPNLRIAGYLDAAEYLLCIAGLFSSQWPAFAFVIVLSLSRFQRLSVWATFLDNMVTAAVFILSLLNKYHLL